MDLTSLSKSAQNKIKRIQLLRDCTEEEAIEFSIVAGWLGAERIARLYKTSNRSMYIDTLVRRALQENSERDKKMQELKDKVTSLLVTVHDFDNEEAAEAVDTSSRERPELWGENSVAEDLANFLASEDNDD